MKYILYRVASKTSRIIFAKLANRKICGIYKVNIESNDIGDIGVRVKIEVKMSGLTEHS